MKKYEIALSTPSTYNEVIVKSNASTVTIKIDKLSIAERFVKDLTLVLLENE